MKFISGTRSCDVRFRSRRECGRSFVLSDRKDMLAHRTQIIERNESDKMGNIEFSFLGVIDLFEFDEVRIVYD